MKRVFILMALSFLAACKYGGESSSSQAKVFKYDGAVQCGASGTALDVMALALISAGIDVVCSQKGDDGLAHAAVCGGGTGSINVYTINAANLPDAQALGFESVSTLGDYQDQQCQ